MLEFLDNAVSVICLILAIYLYKNPDKNPIGEGDPLIYFILLFVAGALKLVYFAQRAG